MLNNMEKIIVLLIFLVACSCPELTMDEVHFKTVDCKNKCINQSNKTMIEYRFSYIDRCYCAGIVDSMNELIGRPDMDVKGRGQA